jgi:hypothetical protein
MPHGIDIESIRLEPGPRRRWPVWKILVRNGTGRHACVYLEAVGRDEQGTAVAPQGTVVLGLGPQSAVEARFDPCGTRRTEWMLDSMTIFWAGPDGMVTSTTRVAGLGVVLGRRAGRAESALAGWWNAVLAKLVALLIIPLSWTTSAPADAAGDHGPILWASFAHVLAPAIVLLPVILAWLAHRNRL